MTLLFSQIKQRTFAFFSYEPDIYIFLNQEPEKHSTLWVIKDESVKFDDMTIYGCVFPLNASLRFAFEHYYQTYSAF